jgi:hypothetical protein
MCCGNKRMALRNSSGGARAAASTAAAPSSASVARAAITARRSSVSVTLRSTESSAARVSGPVTGRVYDFADGQSTQAVELRDAVALMRSGLFQRA